jgi:hypothetical protein
MPEIASKINLTLRSDFDGRGPSGHDKRVSAVCVEVSVAATTRITYPFDD